jgi:beta-galactosidase
MKQFATAIVMIVLTAISMQLIAPGAQAQSTPRETVSLDGDWEIIFDRNNIGREGNWQRQEVFSARTDRREIIVPSCWEEIDQDYEGVGFYGRRFTVSKEWEGKTVRMQFDAVNYIAELYVNDHVAGRHEGGYGPFEFRVDDLLKYGEENFISLRIIGPIVAEDKVIDGIGQSDMPHWRGAIAGGIWQSVRMVASGPAFVDDVFIVPQLKDNTANVQVTLENATTKSRDVEVQVSIKAADGKQVAAESAKLSLVPGVNEQQWTLKISEARYWSPDDPHLYTASVSIAENSTTLDEENIKFGMRELTIRNQKFELNGKPIYIKAAFFEGLYPTKLALPDSPEMARREIQLAKDAGFNMIRPWRKPPPPMWLDMCDEMGVLVVGSMPIECMKRWPTVTPHMGDRIENEVRSGVMRDRNRACIVQWEIFNEIGREDLERLKHSMSMLARRLDPSRLILDESGGFAGGANIYLPYKYEPEVFNDVHKYPAAPLNDISYDNFLMLSKTPSEIKAMGLSPVKYFNSHTKPGRLTFVSEIGYGSLPDLVDNNKRFAESGNPLTPTYRYHKEMARSFREVLKESGLDAIYPDLQQFCLDQQEIHSQGNKRMIEAIRSNNSTGGYAVHALTGGDWVMGAGLIDFFRNPKGSYYGTKEANQPRYLALRVQPRNVYASQGANITVTGINDLNDVSGMLTVDVVSPGGAGVFSQKKNVSLNTGVSPIFEAKLNTAKLSGAYTAKVKLTAKDGSVIAENVVTLDIFPDIALKSPQSKIAVIDINNSLRPFLDASGISYEEFAANTPKSTPVFVSRAIANNSQTKAQFAELEKFVRAGGTAVYLETIQMKGTSFWGSTLPDKEVLPIKATLHIAAGLWIGVSHIVADHPVFEGLPVRRMMGQAYENVWATSTIMDTGGELIVGSVSHDFFGGQANKQNYLGPDKAWNGMDMGVVSHGQGQYLLSALRLLDNLGKDPVADKILFNLIRYVGE